MPAPKKSTKSAKAANPETSAVKPNEKSAASAVQPAISINPANSAQSVAAALAARARQNAPSSAAAGGDSASFKKFKEGLAKPQFSAGSPLAGSGQDKKFSAATGFAKQTGHNQVSGSNVTRTGVPRRTSGG